MIPRTVNKQKRCVLNFEEGIEICQLRGGGVASAMDWIVSSPNSYVEALTPTRWLYWRVFKKVIKVKQGCEHEALIQQNWYLNNNRKSHQHSLPQREGGCLQDRKRFLTRTPLCWNYDLKLPTSRMVRNTFLLFKPPVYRILLD